jgi:hypothetical protein
MAFLVTARVETQLRFREFSRLVELSVNKALAEGAAIALDEVVRAETRDSDRSGVYGSGGRFNTRKVSPGVHLKDSFRVAVIPAFGARFGFGEIVVWTDNPNAIWQELGTRARRRKKLKGGAKPNASGEGSGNRGVAPLYFMRRGFRRAEPKIVLLLQNALHGVGGFGGSTKTFDTVSAKLEEFFAANEPD